MSDSNKPLDIAQLAWRVEQLIHETQAAPRFEQMIRDWAKMHHGQVLEERDRERRWREHFEKTVPSNPRLGDLAVGPPKPDWRWETYGYTRETGTKLEVVSVEGWCPPDLIPDAEARVFGEGPDALPIPLTETRELTLAEQYAVLGAVYNVGTKGTVKIDPWANEKLQSAEKLALTEPPIHALLPTEAGWQAYEWQNLQEQVARLTTDDEAAVEVFLRNVREDAGQDARPEGKGQEETSSQDKPSRPKPQPDASTISDDERLSAAELAKAFGVPYEPLRKRLERYRNVDRDAHVYDPSATGKKPKNLYRVKVVRPMIEEFVEELKEKSQTFS